MCEISVFLLQGSESVDSSPGFDASSAQRDLILSLEAKNREIMKEINILR